jgi:predicted kinase
VKRHEENVMPTLFLICGLPGSGKTTLAKRLEREQAALRLTPDEWMARVVGDGNDGAKRATVEEVQWEIAQRVLSLGVDVILESGFWARSERDDFRARAAALGADTKLYYLEVPIDELKRRLTLRNAALPPDTFHVEVDQLDLWAKEFEPPTPDELEQAIKENG